MTVEPGQGGQELITDTILKIAEVSKYIEQNKLEINFRRLSSSKRGCDKRGI
mgnify:CR=1 FL=1